MGNYLPAFPTSLSWGSRGPATPQLDAIQKIMGAFGKYQFLLCLLIFTSKFFIAFHQIAIVFLGPKVNFECGGGGEEKGIPMKCPCDNPTYDKSIFTNTIVMEWNLICDRKYLLSTSQMLFQFGSLVGSLIFGAAADRYGRRNPMLVACVLQVAAGVGAAYAPSFWSFTFLRFLVGVSVGGTMVTTFVLVMEFVGAQYRDVVSALYQVPFNLGHLMLPLFAYYVREYKSYQLVISAPGVILFAYFVLAPETARWLLAAKRPEEAIKILEKVARVNKLPTANIRSDVGTYMAALQKSQLKKGTILDLFRTPNIRRNIICMSMNWLACSYCFYGVSQYVGQLTGNVFVNIAISAVFALMGTLLSIPLMKVMGRRTMLIILNFIAAGCLITVALLPEGKFSVAMAVIGVMASFIVFVVVYLYCGELFPTVVRNAAVGFSSMMARVGSMIAPFVIDLSTTGRWLPPILFAVFPLLGGCLAFLLPETKGKPLMTTVNEAENQK